MNRKEHDHIILFDGVCNLCNGAVDFVIKRDNNRHFKFGALQDSSVKYFLKDYQIDENYLDSILLISEGKVFYKSRAALEIAKKLNGLWPVFYFFILVPSFIRDPVYDWIAKKRYSWFGKSETCRIPSEAEKSRFI